jgi:hypothetical protein
LPLCTVELPFVTLRLPFFHNAFFEKKEKEPKKKAKRTEKERNYGTTSARPRQERLPGIL